MSRRLLRQALPAVVSVAALAALLASVDGRAVVDALSPRVAGVLLPALLAYGALTLALEARSLLLLVRGAAAPWSGWTAARIKCASYLLGIVHYALGVGALTLLLRRRAGIPLGEAATIVLLISSADLVVVLAFAAGGAALLGLDLPLTAALAVVAAGFFGGLALLRTRTPLGPLERVRSLAALRALRTLPVRRLGALLALRLVFSCCFIGVSGAAFAGFGLWPDPALLVVGMMIVAGVSALPIAVAGLGTGQLAFLAVFRDVADAGTLLAVSLVLSAGMILLRIAIGLVFAREYTAEAMQARQERA